MHCRLCRYRAGHGYGQAGRIEADVELVLAGERLAGDGNADAGQRHGVGLRRDWRGRGSGGSVGHGGSRLWRWHRQRLRGGSTHASGFAATALGSAGVAAAARWSLFGVSPRADAILALCCNRWPRSGPVSVGRHLRGGSGGGGRIGGDFRFGRAGRLTGVGGLAGLVGLAGFFGRGCQRERRGRCGGIRIDGGRGRGRIGWGQGFADGGRDDRGRRNRCQPRQPPRRPVAGLAAAVAGSPAVPAVVSADWSRRRCR